MNEFDNARRRIAVLQKQAEDRADRTATEFRTAEDMRTKDERGRKIVLNEAPAMLAQVNRELFAGRGEIVDWQELINPTIQNVGQNDIYETIGHRIKQKETRLVVPNKGDIVVFIELQKAEISWRENWRGKKVEVLDWNETFPDWRPPILDSLPRVALTPINRGNVDRGKKISYIDPDDKPELAFSLEESDGRFRARFTAELIEAAVRLSVSTEEFREYAGTSQSQSRSYC